MSSSPDSSHVSTHVPALDGVRGLAILAVILHHMVEYGPHSFLLDKLVYSAGYAGWMGVDLFFVLSGFLITGILADTKGSPHFLRNFYARRTLRIFPIYYVSLLLIFVVAPLVFGAASSPRAAEYQAAQGWYWSYLSNWHFVLDPQAPRMMTGHYWSLAVEEQFYMVWPFVVLLLSRRRLLQVCAVAIPTAVALRFYFCYEMHSVQAAYVLTPARMDGLLLGAALALLLRSESGLAFVRRYALRAGLIALVCLGVLAATQNGFWRSPRFMTFGTFFSSLSAVGLIAVCALDRAGGIAKTFSHPLLRFFGKYSYSLYILHPFVNEGLNRIFPQGSFPTLGSSHLPGMLLHGGLVLGLSTVIALLSWRLLEAPILSLKRHFE